MHLEIILKLHKKYKIHQKGQTISTRNYNNINASDAQNPIVGFWAFQTHWHHVHMFRGMPRRNTMGYHTHRNHTRKRIAIVGYKFGSGVPVSDHCEVRRHAEDWSRTAIGLYNRTNSPAQRNGADLKITLSTLNNYIHA